MPPTDAWPQLVALAERLGRRSGDTTLLGRAMAHRSWCAETAGEEPNERLEFLGDAVLGLIVTEHLYTTYPELPEGELAKVRAAVVSAESTTVMFSPVIFLINGLSIG